MRLDPLGAFYFYLTLIDGASVAGTVLGAVANFAVAGFSECSGLDATVEILEYREGGVNDYVHKFPGRASHASITLRRGLIYLPDDLWRWHHGFVAGRGTRKDGLIALLDAARRPAKVWRFTRGIPTKWSGPALNASQSSVAIEALEIAHEGLVLAVG